MAEDVIWNEPVELPARPGLTSPLKRISWGAVWAGVMVALGMELLFTLFGLCIGFGMYHWQAANPWRGISAWSTVWFLVTTAWSMFFGAWCAARLSSNPLTGDSILHGITTWGLATVATMVIAAAASWAVLREGIDVLGTAAVAAGQIAPAAGNLTPGQVAEAARNAGHALGQVQANAGPMAQATANTISRASLGMCIGVLVGFITALLGGLLGRSRPVVLGPADVVPLPTRRAA